MQPYDLQFPISRYLGRHLATVQADTYLSPDCSPYIHRGTRATLPLGQAARAADELDLEPAQPELSEMVGQAATATPRSSRSTSRAALFRLPSWITPPAARSLKTDTPTTVVDLFPSKFNIYCKHRRASSFVLGLHQDEPLYAISTRNFSPHMPDIVLHSNSSKMAPALATLNSIYSASKMSVSLPPMHARDQPHAVKEAITIPGRPSRRFVFETEVECGPPAGMRREVFEWRPSSNRHARYWGAHSTTG